MECKGFDCGNGYCFLAMDPATSGVTWEEVVALIEAGQALPATVHKEMWGKEETPEQRTDHLAMCKRETILLAELALTPPAPPTVTLSL